MYDVIIIGAGVIGSSVARELSKYKLNIIVLEKENDVCEGTTSANSAIIHSGYDPEPNSKKAYYNVLGNQMYTDICNDLDVSFQRNGSITIAIDDEEVKILDDLYERAKLNNVEVRLLSQEELFKMEPNITKKALKGLYAPTAGIINPFELNVALMENAMDNGVELSLNDEVLDIHYCNSAYEVYTNKGIYKAQYVINASGVYTDFINDKVNNHYFDIKARKGEYFVLDHFDNNFIKHTLFNVPSSKGKGVIVAPTTSNNYIVGPSSEFVESKDDISTDFYTLKEVKNAATNLVDYIDYSKQIRQFAGLRAVSSTKDFIIDSPKEGFINIAGIQSPGLTAAPAIAVDVAKFVKNKEINEKFNPKRRPMIRMKNLTDFEKNEMITRDSRFGNIVCRCEKISEGEIVDIIHRNCGATTVKGVKKRVRPGFGKCQGGFCESYVLKILSRELDKNILDIEYGKKGSNILLEPLGGSHNE